MSDPLHGVTLKALLESLVERHGWEELGQAVSIRCFLYEPSINSSLKFLRKNPWARKKVETFYIRDTASIEAKRTRKLRRAARRTFAAMPIERPEALALLWPRDAVSPPPEAPDGIVLEAGLDRAGFTEVQQSIGFDVTDEIWDAADFVPEAMVVAHSSEGPVAVAAAEQRSGGWVELGWVAVAPEHRGQGLGRAVSAALVGALLEAGHTNLVGSTQDERIQALRIYLSLGFEPVRRPEKAARWAAVYEALK
ncbi:MAG: hypothetical protein ACI8S6_002575 [Myxococcota bacterium]|jgi:uncharacterized protein (DUF2132 family)/RimJ/RimL family protein N-acetyltransferase